MTMNEKFEKWWNNYGNSSQTTLFQVFMAGWSIGFKERQEAADIQEKLVLDELRLHLPKGFDIGKAIVSAVTKR